MLKLTTTALAAIMFCECSFGIVPCYAVETDAVGSNKKTAKEKLIDCLVLEQYDEKVGKLRVILAKDRARVDAMNGQVTVLTEAPAWNVFVFNRDKQYYNVSRDDWYAKGIETLVKSRRKLFLDKTNPPKPVIFMGKPSLQVTRQGIAGGDYIESMYQNRQKKVISVVKVTYTATNHLGLSKGASAFCQGLYLTTPSAPVLLDTKSVGAGKLPTKLLVTNSIEHKMLPLSFFSAPKSKMTPGASLSAVVTGKGIEEMLLNFSGAK
jgi:hypothetical protein